MPLYDYFCKNCGKKFEIRISYEDYGKMDVICPFCRSTFVERAIQPVSVVQSDQFRMVQEADSDSFNEPYDDPRELGKMMRSFKDQSGEPVAPEFDEVAERLERGDSIDSIDQDFADMDID